jgi:hypothetical protein
VSVGEIVKIDLIDRMEIREEYSQEQKDIYSLLNSEF